ncbi:hypothetical protein RB593_007119, partial [Gaeumannomyces tritici]
MAKTKRDEREEPTPTTPTRPLENLMPPSHDARPPTPRARLCPRPPSRIQQSHLGCAGLCKSPRSCRFRGRSGPPASRWPTTEAAVCGGGERTTSSQPLQDAAIVSAQRRPDYGSGPA